MKPDNHYERAFEAFLRARDVATFRSLGWQLTSLRAFDCFPMTQHIECVALLEPARG